MPRVILLGSAIPWRETPRQYCSNGCEWRDLREERRRGFDRLCVRCLTWTWDRSRDADELEREAETKYQATLNRRSEEAKAARAAQLAKYLERTKRS